MLNIIASNNYLSIFNYAINKRFNFCLKAKVLEIFNIVNTNNNTNFIHVKTIKLNNKQVTKINKYVNYYN